MSGKEPLILLTNDDGIASPGIWAAAGTLSAVGNIWVIAPREQATSSGRSHPSSSDGIIQEFSHSIDGQKYVGYAAGASPAQCVVYALQDVLPGKPDLVVSGINYGANTGVDITRSGTIGAALEAANNGIPSLAVSLETNMEQTYSYSNQIDFSSAAYFTAFFAQALLQAQLSNDVQVLKVDVPLGATPETPWEVTHLANSSLYIAKARQRASLKEESKLDWALQTDYSVYSEGSDAHVVFVKRYVAVTPLSLDLTSRVDLAGLEQNLKTLISMESSTLRG